MIVFVGLVLVGLISGWMATLGTKSQAIRVVDITLIGPAMIALGGTATTSPMLLRMVVVYFGATTITYNLRNYLAQRQANR